MELRQFFIYLVPRKTYKSRLLRSYLIWIRKTPSPNSNLRVATPCPIFSPESIPRRWRKIWVPSEKEPEVTPQVATMILLPILLQRDLQLLISITMHEKQKRNTQNFGKLLYTDSMGILTPRVPRLSLLSTNHSRDHGGHMKYWLFF